MKFRTEYFWSLVVFNLALVSLALGQPQTLTAAQLIERAKQSGNAFVLGMEEIKRDLPGMSRPEQVYPYLEALDELDKIAKEKKYDVAKLGFPSFVRALAESSEKFVNLKEDSPKILDVVFRWFPDSSLETIAHLQKKTLNPENDKAKLIQWNARIHIALGMAKNAKRKPFVLQALEELHGLNSRKLLALRKDLTPEEVQSWMASTSSQLALEEVLAMIRNEVLETENEADLKLLMQWNLALLKNIKENQAGLPIHLRQLPGQIMGEVISKLLVLSSSPEPELVDTMVENLPANQVIDLTNLLIALYQHRMVEDKQVPFLLKVCQALSKRLGAMKVQGPLRSLGRIYQRLVLQKMDLDGICLEGTYALRLGNRYEAQMSIVNLGAYEYALGVNVDRGRHWPKGGDLLYKHKFDVEYTLVNFRYEPEEDIYRAHRYIPVPPEESFISSQNYHMELALDTKAKTPRISGRFFDGKEFWDFSGSLKNSYTTGCPKAENIGPHPKFIKGVYTGTANGKWAKLSLSPLDSAGYRWSAVLAYDSQYALVDLSHGFYDQPKNMIYLTSGEIDQMVHWTQVRGRFSEDGETFKGEYIQNGIGRRFAIELKKAR